MTSSLFLVLVFDSCFSSNLVFESVDVHGPYRFPELAKYDRFNDTITDHVSDYIQLPQKLMSRDKCEYVI